MMLYHVSFDRVERFIPRVSKQISPGEDTQTPRICLSDSVVRCVNASPGQAWPIYHAMRAGIPVGFYVYKFQTGDVSDKALLSPEEVFKRGVKDASCWHEHWLLEAPAAVTETFVAVRGITYLRKCAPAKWARTLTLEHSEDPSIHFVEDFAHQFNEKFGEQISTNLLYREFSKELSQMWMVRQERKRPAIQPQAEMKGDDTK